MKPLCAIVDGYSSGKFYPEFLKAAGYDCLHVQSKEDVPAFVKGRFCTSSYADAMVNSEAKQTADWLATHGKVAFVIPGCEIGVNLADELSERLATSFQNGIDKSAARRNKYLMSEALRKAGLRAIKQAQVTSAQEALSWIQQQRLDYPIVIKPPESTSGDGFTLCRSADDVHEAFGRAFNQRNLLNIVNETLLVQEFIQGIEYVVDTVGHGGNVVVTDFIRYKKRVSDKGYSVYEHCDFLGIDTTESEVMSAYVKKVLEVLGVTFGPAHAEVMLDKDGPVLIEVGARPSGCMLDPKFISAAYGHNQVELAVLCYTDPVEFAKRAATTNKQLKLATSLSIVAPRRTGRLKSVDFAAAQSLPAFVKVDVFAKVGQVIGEPKNLSESAAVVYLQHELPLEVAKAQAFIMENAERFFVLEKV